MLQSLHIRNYVLISSLDIDFPEGLIVITGPTGAGKSILIGALGLLLGRKADASSIYGDAESCVVEGEFSADTAQLRQFAQENDFEYEGGHFTVRRTVAKSGRSRAFINDVPVPLSVLEEFGQAMVDIHSQHDTRLLTSKSYQLSILDAYAGNASLLERCADVFQKQKALKAEIAALQEQVSKADAEAEYNRAIYEQLASAALVPSEIEDLEQEQNQLANAEQIKEYLAESAELFDSSDDSRQGVNVALGQLQRNLQKLSEYIKDFGPLAQRIQSARLELKDISAEVEAANERMTADPDRLQKVDDRLGLLYGLMKRHSVSTIEDLILKRDSLKGLVYGSEALKENIAQMQAELSALEAEYSEIASELHSRRCASAQSFEKTIKDNLAFMELDRAAFEVQFTTCAMSPAGTDEITFMFNAAGGKSVPVAKCASGGELSRIMLALKQLMNKFMQLPAMVFDEIDTGVSGSVADKMGSVICSMGEGMQVFAITHLPQVAAKGQAHYMVEKTIGDAQASSTIKKLSDEQRVLEIARMLSGSTLSQAAIDNAKALLRG